MRAGIRVTWRMTGKFTLVAGCLLAPMSFAAAQFNGPALTAPTVSYVPEKPTTDAALLYPAAQDLRIGPNDVLSIKLFEAPDYVPVVRVALDGTVQLPLIGIVNVGGMTVTQVESLIGEKLKNAGMYQNPQVSVTVTETTNQYVTVTGEMHAVVPLVGPRNLFDILAVANGGANGGGSVNGTGGVSFGTASGGGGGSFPSTASHIITILRPGVEKPIVVDIGTNPETAAKANIPIFPRDTIIISRIGVVYVLGAFKTQGAIPLIQNTPLTLMQVAALSGGVGFEGKHNDLRIVRTTGLERTMIKVDISAVLQGKVPDPILQADDIIFLPSNAIKAAIKSGGLNTLTGLVSIISYALIQ